MLIFLLLGILLQADSHMSWKDRYWVKASTIFLGNTYHDNDKFMEQLKLCWGHASSGQCATCFYMYKILCIVEMDLAFAPSLCIFVTLYCI